MSWSYRKFSFLVEVGECQQDSDCRQNQACQAHQCENPCHIPYDPCGEAAECHTIVHKAVCQCPPGWAGNPHEECYQRRSAIRTRLAFVVNILVFHLDDCERNTDCPLTKACVDHECVDPCHRIQCGQRAECNVENHVAYCDCPAGLQGNPVVSCSEVGCLKDDDCAQTEKCAFESQRCYPLCRGYACAPGAECFAADHREDCRCRPPLQGNGFSFCEESKCGLRGNQPPLISY